jgi:hypothetical protein
MVIDHAEASTPLVRVRHVLVRREISADYLIIGRAGEMNSRAVSVIVWQTCLDDGSWQINGMTVDGAYFRPSRSGAWPAAVPERLIIWAKSLG